jgi:hypothetical protein
MNVIRKNISLLERKFDDSIGAVIRATDFDTKVRGFISTFVCMK